jgi:hypothetical protein
MKITQPDRRRSVQLEQLRLQSQLNSVAKCGIQGKGVTLGARKRRRAYGGLHSP